MSRFAIIVISLALGATLYGVWRFDASYLFTRPEQDACTFGLVSNARYRELLDEAKRRAQTTWPRLLGEPLEVGDRLRSRIEDLSKGITSPYERVAAMHAVMRASGGYLEGMWPRQRQSGEVYFYTNPEEHSPDSRYSTGADYGYYFHSNYFGPFDLIDA